MDILFYLCSVAVSLYAAYLLFFKTYKLDYNDKRTNDRCVYPRIFYVFAIFVIFIPILNLIASVGYFVGSLLSEIYWIDSWLFDKPNIGNNNNNKDDKE